MRAFRSIEAYCSPAPAEESDEGESWAESSGAVDGRRFGERRLLAEEELDGEASLNVRRTGDSRSLEFDLVGNPLVLLTAAPLAEPGPLGITVEDEDDECADPPVAPPC